MAKKPDPKNKNTAAKATPKKSPLKKSSPIPRRRSPTGANEEE